MGTRRANSMPAGALLTQTVAKTSNLPPLGLSHTVDARGGASSGRARSVGIASHRLRPIDDPVAQTLSMLHKLMFIDMVRRLGLGPSKGAAGFACDCCPGTRNPTCAAELLRRSRVYTYPYCWRSPPW